MQIENISNKYETKISNIKIGECFVYQDELYMKVNIGSIEYDNIGNFPNIAVNLETNALVALIDSVPVKKLQAKIVIE